MNASSSRYTLYGWEVSYYTGKVRSYLRRKGIDYDEVRPTIFGYYLTLPARTGAAAIPVLRTPAGEWLQDSSAIIDHLEAEFPDASVLPESPVQRFAALLIELWGDEFWLPTGLHTRWNQMAENYPFLERDVAQNLLPGWPWTVQRLAARQVARHMYRHLPSAGVIPEQHDTLDRWTVLRLDQLNRHFAEHEFLFGSRASIGDFGLMGPLYGHLSRDPWPRDNLIKPRRHLCAWLERMNSAPARVGEYLADDAISPTLQPILAAIFEEMVPWLSGILERARPHLERGGTIPRFLESVSFPMAGDSFSRPAMPYGLWMLQRMLDSWRAMPQEDAAKVRSFAAYCNADDLFSLEIPRIERRGLRIAAAALT